MSLGHHKLAGLIAATASFSVAVLLYFWKANKEKTRKKNDLQMTLYYYPDFRSSRCVWLATELGIKHQMKFVHFDPKDKNKDTIDAYKRNVNPHGTVPTLVVKGRPPILESGAICLYLADHFQRLAPDLPSRDEYYKWIVYACCTLDEILEVFYIQWIFTKPEDQNEELICHSENKFKVAAEYLSKNLKDRDYICGDRFTAADCVIGYNLWWASEMKDGILINSYPELINYHNRLKRRAAYQQTFT